MYNQAKRRFDQFISENFDMNNEKIRHKVTHTYNVVKMAEYLGNKLNLSEEDKELSQIIALLHDIGRFEQAIKFGSFREDIKNLDHAALGVKILFENNMIREFIETEKYDSIIRVAIANHSKYKFEEGKLNEKQILHSKLIRDADKLDSFRVKETEDIYTMANITKEEIEHSLVSDHIYQDFMAKKTILSKDRKTGIDMWISYIAFIYDFNFKPSLEYIKEKDYINKLIDRFTYQSNDTKTKMEEMRVFALQYLDEKIIH